MSSTRDFKIMVADDSPVYRRLVEETLAEEPGHYTVCFAKNGRDASDLLAEHRPALVITDWEMPDITGIDLCSHIRRQRGPYTYIILLTSNTDKDQIISGLSAGADDYLTKPFHPGELLARVAVGRRIIDLHREIEAKNRQLEEMALTDSLTSLPNRRAVEDWAARQLSGAARHHYCLWVAMADLDSFKNVNDSYGHGGGDLVLQKFADLLRTSTRASDICGRIGGEEFVVVVTHAGRADIHMAIERIRNRLQAERFALEEDTVQVTASFGISGFRGAEPPTFSQLLKEADAALYAAKRAGRNRIAFAPNAPN